MSNNPIACLIRKVEEGLVDKRVGKELIQRSQALLGHFPGDPKKAGAIAAEQLEAEMNAQAVRTGRLGEALREERVLLEAVTDARKADLYVNDSMSRKYRFAKEGNRTLFGAPFAEFMEPFQTRLNRFSEVENRTVIEGIMGRKAVRNPELAGLVRGYRRSMEVIHRTLKEQGAFGHRLPAENMMPVDIKGGRVADVAFPQFREDMSKLDLDFLVENTPFFHKFEGGINEYLEVAHKVLSDGAGVHGDIKAKYGVSAQDFRDHFLRNIYSKDPDSYIKFQVKYGGGSTNFMQSHVSYIDRMAQYTARHEAFGGDIDAYSKWISAELGKKDLLTPAIEASIKKKKNYLNGSLDNHIFLNRGYNVPFTNLNIKPAAIFGTLQSAIPVLLGKGAVIGAAILDPAYAAFTKRSIGVKGTGRLRTFLRTGAKDPVSVVRDNRNLAARSSLTIDYYTDILLDTVRRAEEGTGTKFLDKFSASVMRLYGLTPLTNINRQASLLDISYKLADVVEAPWVDLDSGIRRAFRRAGIGESEWAKITSESLPDTPGGKMLTPEAFIETDLDLARKLSRFFQAAKEKSVPSFGSTVDQWKKEMASTGTFTGILGQSITTFQGFAASIWENWVKQALAGEQTGIYASLIGATTLLGVAQVALENIAKGETTNFTDPNLITDAFVKGGAASFYTEIVSASTGFGGVERQVGSSVLGVTLGTTAQIADTLIESAKKLAGNKQTSVAYDLYRTAEKFNPLQSFWLTSEAYDRAVSSKIRMFLDPKKERKRMRAERRRLKGEGRGPLF